MKLEEIKFENISKKNKNRIETILEKIPKKQIYSTIGVYNDGSKKFNGVAHKDLKTHIAYNLIIRFGRAFFLEGICLYSGYLNSDRTAQIEREFIDNPHTPKEVTAPYQ